MLVFEKLLVSGLFLLESCMTSISAIRYNMSSQNSQDTPHPLQASLSKPPPHTHTHHHHHHTSLHPRSTIHLPKENNKTYTTEVCLCEPSYNVCYKCQYLKQGVILPRALGGGIRVIQTQF